MGSGMPEIGSRISLISKADIRYEGKLYSVDPEECTIALSSVRSFGTEERQTGYPVPPQSQIYDYILFRGSDIKDIRVLSTTIPNDPAIVQLSVPPSMSDPFQSQPGYPPPSIGSITMPNAPSTSRQPPFQSTEFPASTTGSSIQISKPQSVSVPISEDESRSSTPSTQNAVPKNSETRTQNAKSEDQNQSQRKQYNRDNRQGQQGRYPPKQYPQQRYQQTQQRYPQQQQQQQQQQRYQNQQRYMQPQYREYRDNQYRNYDYRDNQYPQRQYQKWNNQGVRTGPQANQQHYQSLGYQNRKPKNTLKFDGDFDFEQANSQFEEVKSKLSTIKIDENAKVNGDVEIKKEDSGNEISGEENEPDNDEKPVFYDKVKSFFDQISYEAIERSKGHTQRLDWKTERKLNSETFGPVALRRNSNFRGRPGGNFYNNYQGRNTIMANNYRGGYRQQGLNRRPGYVVGKNYDDTKENQSA